MHISSITATKKEDRYVFSVNIFDGEEQFVVGMNAEILMDYGKFRVAVLEHTGKVITSPNSSVWSQEVQKYLHLFWTGLQPKVKVNPTKLVSFAKEYYIKEDYDVYHHQAVS